MPSFPTFFRRQKLVKKHEENADSIDCSPSVSPSDQSYQYIPHVFQTPPRSTQSPPAYPSYRSTSNPVPPSSPQVRSQSRIFSSPQPYHIPSNDPSLPPPYDPYEGSFPNGSRLYGYGQSFPSTPGITTLPSGDTELRLQFHGLNYLKQTALGIRDTKALLVYIRKRNARGGFCMHMDPDPSRNFSQDHRFWDMRGIPDRLVCPGRQNRVIYQLSRSLFKYLDHGGDDSPNAVHKLLSRWLTCLQSRCITCGTPQNVKLCRPTVCCSSWSYCETQVRLSMLDVRLMEVRQDPSVAELLLTAVYAAAQADNKKLLPSSPFGQSYSALAAFSSLSSINALSSTRDISHSISNPDAERLLCYACSQYRGFLMSVPSGPYHISGLPSGTIQFLLADAGPQLESKFEAVKSRGGASRPHNTVYFHGTTLDRLYAILTQGLRVLSSDPTMQSNGASYGNGIYLTDAPSVALSYAASPKVKLTHRTRDMLFYRCRVLLCCELACQLTPKTNWGSGNVYVVEDKNCLILRYVFLLPQGSKGVANEDQLKRELAGKFGALRNEK